MASTGILFRRAIKAELELNPPVIGEVVYALDTDEYGRLKDGNIIWTKLFEYQEFDVELNLGNNYTPILFELNNDEVLGQIFKLEIEFISPHIDIQGNAMLGGKFDTNSYTIPETYHVSGGRRELYVISQLVNSNRVFRIGMMYGYDTSFYNASNFEKRLKGRYKITII